jgi:hypothetical protein
MLRLPNDSSLTPLSLVSGIDDGFAFIPFPSSSLISDSDGVPFLLPLIFFFFFFDVVIDYYESLLTIDQELSSRELCSLLAGGFYSFSHERQCKQIRGSKIWP